MKLQLECDRCGKVGDPSEVLTDYDGRDLCVKCSKLAELEMLKIKHQVKKQWLEECHLKDLREMEKKIHDLTVELALK